MITETEKTQRGFAALDAERRRDIARPGGQGVPIEKRGVKFSPAAAKSAAAKGGRMAAHGHSRHK